MIACIVLDLNVNAEVCKLFCCWSNLLNFSRPNENAVQCGSEKVKIVLLEIDL